MSRRAGLAEHQYQSPVERALFALVANRALAPRSKLGVEEWVAEEVAIPGLAEAPVQQQVFTAVADLLNLSRESGYFDTISTYFEVEDGEGDGLRQRGYSRDKRPDPDRIGTVVGLVVTRGGPGALLGVAREHGRRLGGVEVKEIVVGWKLGRVVTVVDRGFVSEENLKELQKAGGHCIAGERLRSGKEDTEAALGRAGRYQWVKEGVEVKEIVVGEGEARKRYVLVRNGKQVERDRTQRLKLVERLEQELGQLRELRGQPHPAYGRYLRADRLGRPHLDRGKLREEARLDGKYLLRTSDDTLAAADVALGYKQLPEVERAFRCLKHDLDLRPMYHRLEERIRSHVLLCWSRPVGTGASGREPHRGDVGQAETLPGEDATGGVQRPRRASATAY